MRSLQFTQMYDILYIYINIYIIYINIYYIYMCYNYYYYYCIPVNKKCNHNWDAYVSPRAGYLIRLNYLDSNKCNRSWGCIMVQ